jgi:hypothetical protein
MKKPRPKARPAQRVPLRRPAQASRAVIALAADAAGGRAQPLRARQVAGAAASRAARRRCPTCPSSAIY